VEKEAFSKYIKTKGKGWVTIWEDFKDNCYLNTILRLVILLNKPLSQYYRDNKYLKNLNNINTIISINIHLFIIKSPTIYKALLASSLVGVYFYTGVAIRVINKT
jgi:hypothetical protein